MAAPSSPNPLADAFTCSGYRFGCWTAKYGAFLAAPSPIFGAKIILKFSRKIIFDRKRQAVTHIAASSSPNPVADAFTCSGYRFGCWTAEYGANRGVVLQDTRPYTPTRVLATAPAARSY